MTAKERTLLMEIARAIAHLSPVDRVTLLSAAWAVEEEAKEGKK